MVLDAVPTAASQGLTSAQARQRLAEVGPNVLAEPPRPSSLRRFLAQLFHLFALLLWAGAVLAWVGGLPELSAAIVVVVLVNAVFAYVQEHRAERATEALKRLLPVSARVRRDGDIVEVPAEELVPGDLLVLRAGDRISADADLVERTELRVDWRACFLFAYGLAGWRPGAPLVDAGPLYVEATTMTQTGIVMGQVGAGLAMRTNRRSVFSVGLFSNRFLLVGIAFEVVLAALLIYVPGLNTLFHQRPIGPWNWLFLLLWPPIVFFAEEGRKALFRRYVWRN